MNHERVQAPSAPLWGNLSDEEFLLEAEASLEALCENIEELSADDLETMPEDLDS
ncbi:hypothetical protein [Nannocystis punicea]|uniref:Uncharacterized protein n=1 Tax=Nannocystis punicea TaxID=2995304 RepID=A0ABY7GS79_9BACT|nr:hypothetical protein [Nannocystis poenicansa]WAS89783.1 hypothetical protein O0S08_26625 [Nannocystis poenicansa]